MPSKAVFWAFGPLQKYQEANITRAYYPMIEKEPSEPNGGIQTVLVHRSLQSLTCRVEREDHPSFWIEVLQPAIQICRSEEQKAGFCSRKLEILFFTIEEAVAAIDDDDRKSWRCRRLFRSVQTK